MAHHVTPHLMFDGNAEQAVTFYVSLFEEAELVGLERYGPGEPGAEGGVKQAEFTLPALFLHRQSGEARLHIYAVDVAVRRV